MKYYELWDNINFYGRWYLGDIIPDTDNWKFTYGSKIDESTLNFDLSIEIYLDGKAMHYTTTEGYAVPIVSYELKKALDFIDDLQFIPVTIEYVKYYIMVVCSIVDCVDETRSEFDIYEKDDLVRPDKAGDYKSFYKLKIDETKAKNNKVFRLKRYDIVIVINEEIKNIIETICASSVKLIEV
jgi:hypothetical protein